MADLTPDDQPMLEPLAAAITAAANGMKEADVAKITGISPQNLNKLMNRRKPYSVRGPSPTTQQQLAKLPGLSLANVHAAVARSLGLTIADDRPPVSQLRQSAHGMVDQIREDDLSRVVQILAAML